MKIDAQPSLATVSDLVGLGQLLQEAGLPNAGLQDAWRAWVLTDPSSCSVVGGVALERYDTADGPAFLLRSLVVSLGMRGGGLGGELVGCAMSAVEDDAEGDATVALLTETADDYFPRFGFVPSSRADLPTELSASCELRGACPDSSRVFVRCVRALSSAQTRGRERES